MKNILKIHLILLSTIIAQSGTITGFVKDKTNDSFLIGANVIIEGTSQGAASDADGHYTIRQVSAGEYTVMVSYI